MFSLKTQWCFGSAQTVVEPLLFELLMAIDQHHSLQKAADELSVSYRFAWGLIKRYEALFEQPLVAMQRGRAVNSHLQPFALQLLQQQLTVERELKPALSEWTNISNEALGVTPSVKTKPICCYASHDLVINQLLKLWNENQPHKIELHTHGSLEGLRLFAEGHCQITGFHVSNAINHADLQAEIPRLLRSRPCEILPLVKRTQGLIVRRGNPKKIQSLKDLCKRSVRFINRQTESGTRILFDQLLEQHAISAQLIQGYEQEEFTHSAVAALIASGAADAGLGIQAVVPTFGLDFIPLVEEHYLVAIDGALQPWFLPELSKYIQSSGIQSYIASLEGYQPLEDSPLGK